MVHLYWLKIFFQLKNIQNNPIQHPEHKELIVLKGWGTFPCDVVTSCKTSDIKWTGL